MTSDEGDRTIGCSVDECPAGLRVDRTFTSRVLLPPQAASVGWTLRADPFCGWPQPLCPDHAHLAPEFEIW
jgi:hypothetical protein